MIWKTFLVIVGTLVVIFIASQLWGLYYRQGADASTAVDVGLVLRSPFYWVMVSAICVGGVWFLKYWLHGGQPK